MGKLESCGPCSSIYGSRQVYNVTAQSIQQWRTLANTAGKNHGMNPVTFLAIASIESDGRYDAVNTNVPDPTYGIVQIRKAMLDDYNCNRGTKYTLNDLIGKGSLITTASGAVAISFDILGLYMGALNKITNSFKLTATGWNVAICGQNGSFSPFGSNCGYNPIPSGSSCYGEAALKLASAYSGWWINPNTGKADSFFFGDLQQVSTSTLPTYNAIYYGP